MIWLILLMAVAALGGKSSGSGGGSVTVNTQGLAEFRRLAAAAGLNDAQTNFLAFVARGESGLKSNVGLGISSRFPSGTKPNTRASSSAQEREAGAAMAAYNSNRGWLDACDNGYPPTAYGFGSGGLFAQLPTYALAQYRGTGYECASPFEVFNPAFAIPAAYSFARGLTKRSGYLGTWESLRSGWGLPSQMDNLERIAGKRDKWRGHLSSIGLSPSLLSTKAPDFPRRDLVAMMRRIEAVQ